MLFLEVLNWEVTLIDGDRPGGNKVDWFLRNKISPFWIKKREENLIL